MISNFSSSTKKRGGAKTKQSISLGSQNCNLGNTDLGSDPNSVLPGNKSQGF